MTPGDLPIFDQTDHGIKLIEEERRRIARDLHDGPAQAITNVSMRLDIVRRLMDSQPNLAAEELDRLQQRVRGLVSEVRRLIYDLRPVAIDEVGVVQATVQLCERNQHDWEIPIRVEVSDNISLNIAPARQVAIYRMIQEILNNVHKHAEATEVVVSFEQLDQNLVVRVVDNGKGFHPDSIPEGHFGIAGLKERVAFLNGELTILSAPGTGSTFEIHLPVYIGTK
ncbi:sensor histidine kinase [Alicyclobacillus mengziensis]|uniref:Oxygen sensor histidine kinase NreB n=1 Tax=Alicyclobacillus mengziensis TaxID=2931921 RepID=A0A9X7VYY1_9BACL|nr:sensor histidine kinase [Alicyclobacillus mengziensis]QSO47653.1 sensor histidine kinase [Alicyclobacillus mengziensis]